MPKPVKFIRITCLRTGTVREVKNDVKKMCLDLNLPYPSISRLKMPFERNDYRYERIIIE